MEMTTGFTRWTIMYIWFSRHNRNVTNAKIRIERSKHQCQIGVEDGGYYIPVLGIGLHVTMVENSSDPRLVLYMWRMASGVLLSKNISLTMSTVKFSVNMHFFVGHVSCLRILIVILKNNKLRTLWFLHRMRPCGQTPPLDKCEQLDLKHIKAMLQNYICLQNSPRGAEAFVFWTMDYTFGGERTDSPKYVWVRRL